MLTARQCLIPSNPNKGVASGIHRDLTSDTALMNFRLGMKTSHGRLEIWCEHHTKTGEILAKCTDQDGTWSRKFYTPEEFAEWIASFGTAGAIAEPIYIK